MKEITRINLASLPYNIDIEAKKTLEKYCLEIERNLGVDADAMKEIELRMTELLAERKVIGETVVSLEDVNFLRQQLGKPDDFADNLSEGESLIKNDASDELEKPVKRLMRDVDNRMLGGVCSGLAAYFKIDPVLVRVVAIVLLVVSFGVMLPIYLLLWLIIPPARTAADRLAMAGRPVTLEAIQKESSLQHNGAEPLLLIAIRFLAAATLIFGALSTLAVMASYISSNFTNYIRSQTPLKIALTSSVVLSGVLFAVMLGLLAYILLTKKFTKRVGIALVTVIVLGLTSFGVGIFGLRGGYQMYNTTDESISQNMLTKDIDAAVLNGAEELSVYAPAMNVAISYRAIPSGPAGVRLSYDNKLASQQPKVTLERQGKRAVLKVDAEQFKCVEGNCMLVQIDLNGPMLTKIINSNSRLTYATESQEELNVEAIGAGGVDLFNQSGLVNNLVIQAHGSAYIVAANLAVNNVKADMSEASQLTVGNVGSVAIQTPDICRADNQKVRVLYYSAKEVKLNGEVMKDATDMPCFTLEKATDPFNHPY